jgi:hypothetical protein
MRELMRNCRRCCEDAEETGKLKADVVGMEVQCERFPEYEELLRDGRRDSGVGCVARDIVGRRWSGVETQSTLW